MKPCTLSTYNSSTKLAHLVFILIALGVIATSAFAQQTTISLGSGTTTPGGSVAIDLLLTASGGAQPAGIQWTMNYSPADIASVSVAAGASAAAAGKSIACATGTGSTTCVLYGMNPGALSNGIAATATFSVPSGSVDSLAAIQITGVVMTDANGIPIPSSGTLGSINILQPVPPTLSSISCAPSSVNAPASATCVVTLSGPALSNGSTVTLSSNNVNIAVPANVVMGAGQSSASFAATVGNISSNQTATLTASISGSSITFALTASAPAQISSVSCSPSTLSNNASSTCTIALNKAALAAGSIVLSSSSVALTVPASVTISAGQSSATFVVTSQAVTTAQNVTVSASLNGITQSTSIGLTVPVQPASISCSPATVTAPGTATCTILLTAVVPAGGATIALSSNNANITVPSSVGAVAGQNSTTFNATVANISTYQTGVVTGSLNGAAQSTTIAAVAPAQISSLSCSPSTLTSNASSACTVTLNKAALVVSTVMLSSSNPALTVPASVTASVGQSSAAFSATTASVTAAQNITVTGSLNGLTQSTSVSVTVPVQPGSMTCSPATVNAPGPATCTIMLTSVAPAGGVTVALSSNNANITVPASVAVTVGNNNISFTAAVASISTDQTATLTASLNGTSQTTTLSASAPARISSLSCSPLTLRGNSSTICTVILNEVVNSISSVFLSSSKTLLTIPASVNVSVGQNSATFSAATGAVTSAQSVTITAALNNTSQSASISLTVPVPPTSLTATPGSGPQINLAWSAPIDTIPISQYLVERCQGTGCTNFAQIGTSVQTTFNDLSVAAATSYSYRVRVSDAFGNQSGYSNTATAALPAATTSISYVQGSYATPQTYNATVSVTFTGAQAAGDLNVVAVGWSDSTAKVKSVTDTRGNVYAVAVSPTVQAGVQSLTMYYAKNISASPAWTNTVTVTFTTPAYSADVRILEYHGADLNNPLDGATGNYGSGTSSDSGALVTTNATDLLVAASVVETHNTGVGAGFTSRMYTEPDHDIVEDRMVTTAGRYTGTAPVFAGNWILQMAAFRTVSPFTSTQSTPAQPPVAPAAKSTSDVSASEATTLALANVATGIAGDVCSPGGLAAILGSGLVAQGAQKGVSFPLPTRLSGVQVKVNGLAAPILLASDSQINFQCPLLAAGTPLTVTVEGSNGVVSAPIQTEMQPAAPGLFTVNGTKQGVILIANTNEIAMETTNRLASRPANPGEFLTVYMSGLGESVEEIAAGDPAPSNRQILLKNKVSIVVGELEIEPSFAGLAPGTAGLYQVNLQLPAGAPTGNSIPLYVNVTSSDGTVRQSNSVNVAIQAADPQR